MKPDTGRSTAGDIPRRLDYVIEQLGSNQTARLLRVNQSQPSRWRARIEGAGSESRRRILDLDYVLARLLEIYPHQLAELWLESHNAHLGARPIDVLQLRGAAPVIEAIDAEAEGAFA
jgi:hypothetical protein